MASTGVPLNPSLNYDDEMTGFHGNFSKHPAIVKLICLELNKLRCVCWGCAHASVCMCRCVDGHVSAYTGCVTVRASYAHISRRADISVSGERQHIFASHTCGSSSEHILHRGQNLNSCRSSTSKVPKQGTHSPDGPGLWEALPKVHCVICSACLSPSVSPTWMSSCLVSPPCTPFSSSCPSILAAVEVTFINGEFMCMTAPKPELWLHHPWRLSVNSCNHQSAKYLPFKAHQPCMRWLRMIYRIKSINSTADLHWYWYGLISSWLCLSEREGFTL